MKVNRLEACWFGAEGSENAAGATSFSPEVMHRTQVLVTVTPEEDLPLVLLVSAIFIFF